MRQELIIRPARPGDRSAMERICAGTWDWGDYVPEVWDAWLADLRGLVIVGECSGVVVALSKITFQPARQVWLEGMRVDPAWRGHGIGAQFLNFSLNHARKRGARVVRLGTTHHNTAVHRLADRAGMVFAGSYVLRAAEPNPDGPPPRLTAAQASEVAAFLHGSPVLTQTSGLYNADWIWQELSDRRARQLLEDGQVIAQVGADGKLRGLAVVSLEPDGEVLWVAFADGEPEAVTRLAGTARWLASKSGAERVQVMLPELAWLRNAFQEAGYGPGDWDGELWIFERWLKQGASPGPVGDDRES